MTIITIISHTKSKARIYLITSFDRYRLYINKYTTISAAYPSESDYIT